MFLQLGLIVAAIVAIIVFIIIISLLASSIKVIPEYQRAVRFRLGRITGLLGPGLVFIIPIIDTIIRYDLRIEVVDVPQQKALTKDNVEVTVDAAVYLRVVDPLKVAVTVRNHVPAVSTFAAAALRDVVGMVDLDTLLSHREEIARRIAEIVDEHVTPWGVKVTGVAIRDIRLPEALVRAMASQAEAERLRRAKITIASAEYEASKIYMEAANTYAKNPIAVQLRQIDALLEMAREHNLIIVTPSSLEFVALPAALAKAVQQGGSQGGGQQQGGGSGGPS